MKVSDLTISHPRDLITKSCFLGYELAAEILDECHTTFLSCYNTFYPTTTLKWNSLCDLLQKKDKVI